MNLSGLPVVGQLYLPFLLTSLIIGMVILIWLEKRKTLDKEAGAQKTPLKDNDATLSATQGPAAIASKANTKDVVVQDTQNTTKEESCSTEEPAENSTKEGVSHETSSSCSSSSGSEEDVSRPRRVVRRPKKKHTCKGSAIICATKRKVTAVTIITDSQEEEVQVSLEDLAEEMKSHGVTCNVHPATTTHLPHVSTEPSHLLLLFGTTSEGCQHLQESLTSILGGGGGGGDGSAAAAAASNPFLYSVTCWSAAASGDVYESAQNLSASLGACGGAEWLPITCITTATKGEEESKPPHVMGRQKYVKTVMDKITKPGKKCCGTSCGSKTVDIEDLASSLLLSRAAVTS